MNNDLSSRILYCDSNCIVVNKIAGEACEGAGSKMVDLPKLLATTLSDQSVSSPTLPEASPPDDVLAMPTAVHRLDVPVSGCAVFARTNVALSSLTTAFRSNTVKKYYWGIVEMPENDTLLSSLTEAGPFAKAIELTHWIQFDPKHNKSFAYDEPGQERKKAILRCRLAGRGRDYLFLEIELVTGRHHQIRAQFERLNLHIKGDLKYGARRSERNGGIRLHARSLSFPNPADNNKCITVQADPPLRDNLWLAFEESQLP